MPASYSVATMNHLQKVNAWLATRKPILPSVLPDFGPGLQKRSQKKGPDKKITFENSPYELVNLKRFQILYGGLGLLHKIFRAVPTFWDSLILKCFRKKNKK